MRRYGVGVASWDAIVLAADHSRRLGGVDKPMLELTGRPLLTHVLDAVGGASRRIVVGPVRDLPGGEVVLWCQEQPAGGGPVAGLAAGLELVTADRLVVLPADMPFVAPAVAPLLDSLDADPDADVAVLVDQSGRRNYLAAAWRRSTLAERLIDIGPPHGQPMRHLLVGVGVAEVIDGGGWSADCDTWPDLESARKRAETGDRS